MADADKYDSTGSFLGKIEMDGEDSTDLDNDAEIMTLLLVVLVARDREPEKKQTTPITKLRLAKLDAN